jgi:hypothetical protein
MDSTSEPVVELNCFARGICLSRCSGGITADTPPDDIIATARGWLLRYWREDPVFGLVPAMAEWDTPTPDEVVVRGADGRALYRRTIIDEKIERWFAET